MTDFPVTRLPPGEARGSHELRRRGMNIDYDPTCWPDRERFVQSTGAEPKHVTEIAAYLKLLTMIFIPETDGDFRPDIDAHDASAWAWITRWRREARSRR